MLSLDHLNPEQRRAVETSDGRILVLAGAGSGKTLVLTTRMAHLIAKGVAPSSILGLTFTNKAAQEMRERIARISDKEQAKQVKLCTFHSFCMEVLRKHIHKLGYTSQFSLYDEKDLDRILEGVAKEVLGGAKELPSLGSTKQLIQEARMQGLTAQEIQGETKWHEQFTQDTFRSLRTTLKAFNAVDFDDLLYLTHQLFVEHPEVLEEYHNQYHYVMIDEYQDTNPIQYKISSMICSKHGNLCVVGDDDQSIYGWRGACVTNILEFKHDESIKLEQNYRSTNTILNAANAVISNNPKRHGKSLWSDKTGDTKIEIFHAPTELKEVEAVLHRLVKLKQEKNLKWQDIAILYRSNHLSRAFEIALTRFLWKDHEHLTRGIPYRVFGGLEFYMRKEVQDLFAYLKVVCNTRDQASLLRIINYPPRGIGNKSIDVLTTWNRKENISLWETIEKVVHGELELDITPKCKQSLIAFHSLLERLKSAFESKDLTEATSYLVEQIGFKEQLNQESRNTKVFGIKWDNVSELLSSVDDFVKEHPKADLSLFLSQSILQENSPAMKKRKENVDCLHLMTFHSAKGLEFKACYLVGVEDHIIPHERSMKDTGIEEERRLMYVAITRAKQYLTMSMSMSRKRMGKLLSCKPSRFLFEIPKEYLNVTKWDEV